MRILQGMSRNLKAGELLNFLCVQRAVHFGQTWHHLNATYLGENTHLYLLQNH